MVLDMNEPIKEETPKPTEGKADEAMPEINDISPAEKSRFIKLELGEFDGKKRKIEIVMPEWGYSSYDIQGNLVKGLQRKVMRLRVESEILKNVKSSDGKDIGIRAREWFNLNQDYKGKWTWSVGVKGKLNNFLKKIKVNNLSELKGRTVALSLKISPSGKEFLGFGY